MPKTKSKTARNQNRNKHDRAQDMLNVRVGVGEIAFRLAELLTKEKGVPVSRALAVELAIFEAIRKRER